VYIPSSPARLFSPPHWAQCQDDHKPMRDGTWQATLSDHVFLNWGQRNYKRNIPYNKVNVSNFLDDYRQQTVQSVRSRV
jgi:hypothetical protein